MKEYWCNYLIKAFFLIRQNSLLDKGNKNLLKHQTISFSNIFITSKHWNFFLQIKGNSFISYAKIRCSYLVYDKVDFVTLFHYVYILKGSICKPIYVYFNLCSYLSSIYSFFENLIPSFLLHVLLWKIK